MLVRTRNNYQTFESLRKQVHLERRQQHLMQQDTDQKGDAKTRASSSHDETMNDRRENARKKAEELIAEEKGRGTPGARLSVYLIALIIGLLIWAAIYYLWRAM